MAAIDNPHLIEILEVTKNAGIGKKSGQPYEIYTAQCVVRSDKGIQVGTINMPKHLIDTKPGKYLAEFELGINFDNKIIPLLTTLHPHGDTKPTAAPKG